GDHGVGSDGGEVAPAEGAGHVERDFGGVRAGNGADGMNDSELDGLLESWEAPAPPASLREGLRARFPRAERRGFARPLRWALAIAVASATLGIGMEQMGESGWDFRLVQVLNQMYEHVVEGLEA